MRSLAERDVLGAPLRRLQALVGGTGLALIYHRVADVESDPQLQAVPVERFARQMEVLARDFEPISVLDLTDHLTRHARLPSRAIVVTFDDGYADNFHNAYPILARLGIPATIFVNSAGVDSPRLGWVDELESLVLRARELPTTVRVESETRTIECDLGEHSAVPEDPTWNITTPAATPRTRLYVALANELRSAGPEGRERILGQLREQVGAAPSVNEGNRSLSLSELRELASSGLVTIGAHTVSHRHLASASNDELTWEITEDKRALEEMAGGPVEVFSYPYGGPGDYDERSVETVRAAGFRAALSNHFGAISPWTNRVRIPRVSPIGIEADSLTPTLLAWMSSGK